MLPGNLKESDSAHAKTQVRSRSADGNINRNPLPPKAKIPCCLPHVASIGDLQLVLTEGLAFFLEPAGLPGLQDPTSSYSLPLQP